MGEVNWDNLVPTGVTTNIGGSEAVWKDGDTFRHNDTDYRIAGLSADETWKVIDGEVKPGQWLGNVQTQEFGKLAEGMGYNNIIDTGEETYGRKVADLTNDRGQNFTDALYENGLVRASKWATPRQQELAEAGNLNRWMNEALARENGGEVVKSDWDIARDNINNFKRDSIVGFKGMAYNEREAAAGAIDGQDFSAYTDTGVQSRHGNQDMHGNATGVFKAGFEQGWHSIKESAAGGLQVLGDVFNSDYFTDWGERDLAELKYEAKDAPSFVQDIGEVTWGKNFSDYVVGMAGVSIPYMLGIIGSAGAGTVALGAGLGGLALGITAPVWVYAGEVYNNMEGDRDTKNAGTAIGAGILMATADRLGLQAILGTGKQVLRKSATDDLIAGYAKREGVSIDTAKLKLIEAQLETGKDVLRGVAQASDIGSKRALATKVIGAGFAKGAASESITETFQESTGFIASHFGSELTQDEEVDLGELGKIALNAAIGGALLGGGISGTLNTKSELQGLAQVKHEYGTAKTDASEGFLEGTLDEELADAMADLHVGDSEFVVSEAVRKGEKARKGRSKWEKFKEGPSAYFRKRGARWESKILNDPNIPAPAKRLVKLINSTWMPSNTSWVEGTNQWAQQNTAENLLIRRSQDLMGHTTAIFGELTDNNGKRAASDKFIEWKAGELVVTKEQEAALVALDKGLTDVTDGLRKLVEKATGEKIGYTKDYFIKALQFSPEAMLKNKAGFINALIKKSGYTSKKANELYDSVVHGKEFEGKPEWLTFDRQNKSTLKRKAKLTDNSDLDEFMEKDLFKKLDKRIVDMTGYAYDVKYLGKRDEKVDMLLAKLKEEMGSKWDPRYALEVKESIDANRGRYKRVQNETVREAIKNVSFFGALTQLDTSMLASLPEVALVLNAAVREGGIAGVVSKIWKAQKVHFKETGKEAIRRRITINKIPTSEEINPSKEDINLARQSYFGGGYGSQKHGVLGAEDIERGSKSKADINREIILENFFRFNLLKPFTDGTRVGALAIANDSIFSDLDIIVGFYNSKEVNSNYVNDAYDRLRELKINPVKAAEEYKKAVAGVVEMRKNNPDVDTFQYIYQKFPDLYKTLELARHSFVDNKVAKPTVVDRPLWYSNGYLRLGVQYQGFLSTFTAHILPRLWKQAKAGDPTLRWQAFSTAAMMVALAALGQMLKDEWKFGEASPYVRTDAQKIQRAVGASGLLGTGERFLDLIHPIYGQSGLTPRPGENAIGQLGRIGGELAETVPASGTVKNLYKTGKSLVTDDGKLAGNALKHMPLIGRAKWWKDIYE